jgi:hypothetical protein
MEEEAHQIPEIASTSALGRRKFLVRAAVAGTAAWAVPTIITLEPAGAAALTSPPPTPPEVEVLDETVVDDPTVKPQAREALAATGAPIDTMLGAGAAAIAGGGALHVWSTRAGYRIADAAEASPPAAPPAGTG